VQAKKSLGGPDRAAAIAIGHTTIGMHQAACRNCCASCAVHSLIALASR
jgi:hypothetical protein